MRNSKGDLPLHEAVTSGRRELVKWLLDGRPSQVNATNHEGRTPLHIAAATDNADLCRLLLDRGAEVNSVSRSSKNEPVTPLDAATSRGHRSIAKYLQMHGGLPASKLANTEIIIDEAPIIALPTRKVTSTTIDVQDRIRIEKREVVELSSPVYERRIIKSKSDTTSSDDSATASRRISRKKVGNKYHDKHHERRRRFMQPQKSFSDGYDTDIDGNSKNEYYEQKYRKLKKQRSKSEPSKRNKSAKYRHRYYRSGSESSSYSESYQEKKKSKSHRKRSKRKSSSSSESSSSESTERRSTKRKGKKTSIHIENDDIKQRINIVKYKSKENSLSINKDDETPTNTCTAPTEVVNTEVHKVENQIEKSLPQSGNETDTISIKASKIVTEAQIHIERESNQQANAEITVTVDSLNNVSIETLNMTVEKNETLNDTQAQVVNSAVQEKTDETNKDATLDKDLASNETSTLENEITESNKFQKPNEVLLPFKSNSLTTVAPDNTNNKLDEVKQDLSRSPSYSSKDGKLNEDPVEEAKESEIMLDSKVNRKKSFQVLSGPDVQLNQSKNTSEDIKTSLDAFSTDTSERLEKTSSPIVSFASKDYIFESKESENQSEQKMAEGVVNSEHVQRAVNQTQNDLSKSNDNSSEEKRKVNTINSDNTDILYSEKGLVSVLDNNGSMNEVIREECTEEQIPEDYDVDLSLSQQSPRRSRNASRDSQASSRKNSIYETESYKVLSDIAPGDITAGILKKTNKIDNLSKDSKESFSENKFSNDNTSIYGRIPSISDNEMYQIEANGRRKRFRKKGRAKSRTTIRSMSEQSERGYESSGFMDSGFEPSPRALQRRITSPRLAAYYKQRNAGGRYSGKPDSRIPVRKPGDKYAVDMKSVTQRIQTNMRR